MAITAPQTISVSETYGSSPSSLINEVEPNAIAVIASRSGKTIQIMRAMDERGLGVESGSLMPSFYRLRRLGRETQNNRDRITPSRMANPKQHQTIHIATGGSPKGGITSYGSNGSRFCRHGMPSILATGLKRGFQHYVFLLGCLCQFVHRTAHVLRAIREHENKENHPLVGRCFDCRALVVVGGTIHLDDVPMEVHK
jgi:hypothetical protein